MGCKLLQDQGPKLLLTTAERARLDEAPDSQFYAAPRMMQHAEPEFIEAVTSLYRRVLAPGASVLELCASRHSHLPQGLQLSQLVGQGMNGAELEANQALSQWFVQDLNEQPLLLEQLDGSWDAVLCVNGVQYLTQPEAVLAEVHRVLRPGGLLCLAFGSHCFQEKATAAWLNRTMLERAQLITSILEANRFERVRVLDSMHSIEQQLAGTATRPLPAAAGAGTDICVLLALKEPAAAAAAQPGAGIMAPSNVADWFTKPGLSGLQEAAAGGAGGATAAAAAAEQPSERLLEQWRAAYEVLVSDAAAMGIPRSVIPAVARDASPAEIQEAVQHLQAMVASFLSSGL